MIRPCWITTKMIHNVDTYKYMDNATYRAQQLQFKTFPNGILPAVIFSHSAIGFTCDTSKTHAAKRFVTTN